MEKKSSFFYKKVVNIAHFGFRDWIAQRVSAIVLALYTSFFICAIIILRNDGYPGWSYLFQNIWMKIASSIAVLSLCYHAWVGIRDIWMDYIKPVRIRLSLQVFSILWLVGCGLWALLILFRV